MSDGEHMGRVFESWDKKEGPRFAKEKRCPNCGAALPGSPMAKHDAYWCAACDAWLEKGCTDATCGFCAKRPAKPSMVPENERGTW